MLKIGLPRDSANSPEQHPQERHVPSEHLQQALTNFPCPIEVCAWLAPEPLACDRR